MIIQPAIGIAVIIITILTTAIIITTKTVLGKLLVLLSICIHSSYNATSQNMVVIENRQM